MLTLPGLLAAMARGEVASFPALRPHQRPAWHMFLVQLATLALSDTAATDLPEDEESWRRSLRGLTADFPDDAPWHLVVEDRGKPAFLQPPDPGGLKWHEVATPDALDMLITSRNHDIKREIAHEAAPQDWIFALVSLQTMEGYQLKYSGIVRMNSGASSRVMLTLAPIDGTSSKIKTSAWWRRDVQALLSSGEANDGLKLLWLEEWPHNVQLSLLDLHPLFIEVCRRVRLGNHDRISGAISTALKGRIDAESGAWPDPWAPRKYSDGSALTLGTRDFDYSLMKELIWGTASGASIWVEPALFSAAENETTDTMAIVAEAFARGKGGKTRTDGFMSRVIPMPKVVKKEMMGPRAVELSDDQVKAIKNIDIALRDSLRLLACDGDWEKRKQKLKSNSARAAIDERLTPARAALHRVADALFFPTLWDKLSANSEDGRHAVHMRFVRQLAQAARDEFARAAPGIPCARIMRPRAEVRGRAALNSKLARIFKEIGEKEFENV
jgi:CRISPR system Cascade subunit CasA